MDNINSSTVSSEEHRKQLQRGSVGSLNSLQQQMGVITKVHETLPLIQVQLSSGQLVHGGNWIYVANPVLDILQRFGTLRDGLKVLITFMSGTEGNAIATIIGNEDEQLGVEEQQENEAKTGLYEIYTPGAGSI